MRMAWATVAVLVILVGEAQAEPFRFSPDGCEFAVSFPTQPKLKSISSGPLSDQLEAELSGGGSLLRATCAVGISFRTGQAKTAILEYFTTNGMKNAEASASATAYGFKVEGRAVKMISNTWVTYAVAWHIAGRSALVMGVASASADFPTSTIWDFQSSLEPR